MTVEAGVLPYIFGGFVVYIFCRGFFNEPRSMLATGVFSSEHRSDFQMAPVPPIMATYRYLYNLYSLLFLVVVETFYVLMAFNLDFFLNKAFSDKRAMGYNAIVAALIILGVLPRFSFVEGLLEKIRAFFHDLAKIPSKGQEYYSLVKGPIEIYNVDMVCRVLEHRYWNHISLPSAEGSRQVLVERDFTSRPRSALFARWAQLTYLLCCVDIWSQEEPLQSILVKKDFSWDRIRSTHTLLMEKLVSPVAAKEEVEADVDMLFSNACQLMVCLLLHADTSGSLLVHNLEKIGYRPNDKRVLAIDFRQLAVCAFSAGLGVLAGAAIALAMSLMASLLIQKSYSQPDWFHQLLQIMQSKEVNTTLIVTWSFCNIPFLMAPTLLVLLVKRYLSPIRKIWPLVTPYTDIYADLRERPWHIYFLISAAAYPASYLTLCALKRGVHLFHQEGVINTENAPVIFAALSLVGVVTAFFVAFRIDSPMGRMQGRVVRSLKTLAGCLLQGAATIATFFFVIMHTMNHGSLRFWGMEHKEQSFLFVNLVIGLCSGAALFLTSRFNTDTYERREHARTPTRKRAVIYIGANRWDGEMRNVSQGGAHVHLVRPPSAIKGVVVLAIEGRPNPMPANVMRLSGHDLHLKFLDAEEMAAAHAVPTDTVLSEEESRALLSPDQQDLNTGPQLMRSNQQFHEVMGKRQ